MPTFLCPICRRRLVAFSTSMKMLEETEMKLSPYIFASIKTAGILLLFRIASVALQFTLFARYIITPFAEDEMVLFRHSASFTMLFSLHRTMTFN